MHNNFNNNINNNSLCRLAFGWNYKSWSHALKLSNLELPYRVDKIIEIGAGKNSMTALLFDGLAKEIVISYYRQQDREAVEQYLNSVRQRYKLYSKYVFKQVDAFNLVGSYDIVIMKSVLGGLFRNRNSSISDANDFIAHLVSTRLKPGGQLISIDNGKSILERLISKFGARKNKWFFYKKLDLRNTTKQTGFGLLSSFCFETRLGYVGNIIDNFVIYPLDLILVKFWRHNPTIIVSIFKNHS